MEETKSPGGPPPPANPDPQPPPYTAGAPGGAPPGAPAGGYPPQGATYPPQAAYPAQPGYPQQPGMYQPAHTTVIVQPGMGGAVPGSTFRYGQIPAMIICQHCGATVTTSISYESGLLTWAACGMICLFMCWLGCCLIPFCVDAAKDVVHTCPSCKQLVGKFRHFN